MGAVTLATLKARVLERANMVGSGFIADAELVSIINGEAAELHDTVVGAFADQFTTSLEFTIASGNTYAIEPEMYELRGVDVQQGSEWVDLDKSQWNERNEGGTDNGFFRRRQRGCGRKYRLVGQLLHITPTQGATGTYRLWYVPEYVDLVDDADSITYPQNWHEAILAGSAAKCLAKEESDASIQLGLKAAAIRRIEAMAAMRDASGPETIEFTRNRAWDEEF